MIVIKGQGSGTEHSKYTADRKKFNLPYLLALGGRKKERERDCHPSFSGGRSATLVSLVFREVSCIFLKQPLHTVWFNLTSERCQIRPEPSPQD